MAPKTSYLASGGKDGQAMIWNLVEGKFLSSCDAETPVNVVLFAPKKYWLILGTDKGIKVWDLPSKEFIDTITVTPLDPN
jgi:guanine nucleotide-binding protein subunit beta-2-like 1 protein